MAERPVFLPTSGTLELVKEKYLTIVWSSGFAPIQKKKNVTALHEAARRCGYAPLLEISSKSEEKLGQHLSAFHLKVHADGIGEIKLECAFQGSKVFEKGGPYSDLYLVEAKAAKTDPRIQESGRLIGFKFNNYSFPLEPKTIFYDWLYALPSIRTGSGLRGYIDMPDSLTLNSIRPDQSIAKRARALCLFPS